MSEGTASCFGCLCSLILSSLSLAFTVFIIVIVLRLMGVVS